MKSWADLTDEQVLREMADLIEKEIVRLLGRMLDDEEFTVEQWAAETSKPTLVQEKHSREIGRLLPRPFVPIWIFRDTRDPDKVYCLGYAARLALRKLGQATIPAIVRERQEAN